MKILMVSSEMVPFAKTGGLADVVGALPYAFESLKCQVKAIIPFYLMVEKSGIPLEVVYEGIPIELGNERYVGNILKAKLSKNIEVFFVQQQQFYSREQLYGTSEGDYPDNAKRFIFFNKMIIRFCELAGYEPDIIHCHDWQAGLVPVYVKILQATQSRFKPTSLIFTIHNIAYQGLFEASDFMLTGLPPAVFSVPGVEYWGKVNLLKAGINFSDYITTVSPKYSYEIQTAEYGYGIDGILRDRADRIVGILNGVDYTVWNPENDPHIAANYSVQNLKGKTDCKIQLLKIFKLSLKFKTKPLVGIISRLTDQKGFDILAPIVDQLIQQDLAIAILGTGEQKYHDLFTELAQKYPKQIGVRIAYDNKLAHQIEAGSDIFLMPSKFEPCGLNQIYSLKYGTIPIVRATGGLDDTIEHYFAGTPNGNGFKFYEYSPDALLKTIDTAIGCYQQPDTWQQIIKNAMRADFSWTRSAKSYLELFINAQAEKSYNMFVRFL